MNDLCLDLSAPSPIPYTPTSEDIVLLIKLHRIIEKGNDAEIKRARDGGMKVLEVKRRSA